MLAVDKIITISLKENHLRQQLCQKELEKLQLKTDFFLAERDLGHEERGCFNSHLAASKMAFDMGSQSALIFEDDVKILPFQEKQITAINHFITQKILPFDILYLGLIIGKIWFCGVKSIVRAKGAATHAYILSRQGMEKLMKCEYQGVPIDKTFKHQFKCYSVYPIIAEQQPEIIVTSDITTNRVDDKIKDELFWKENYVKQKYLPWMNLHKTIAEFGSKIFYLA